ncbi:MAG: putative lipoprotein YfhM [Paracidovorax wautersii]|uniref:Putative lipoprotein YfhM n=1 Tax=Paracidovorax wautersii TaxID=1177982 RepID=A0A7V8FQ33_9BURK|nr:MAG: putative lipoprotein YfhM [Paracidovorax wautersii]
MQQRRLFGFPPAARNTAGQIHGWLGAMAAGILLALPAVAQTPAAPLQILSVSPQGSTTAEVRQIVAKFNADAVAFGDPQAAAPLSVGTFRSPTGQAVGGTASYRFDTGGPALQRLRPGTWQDIEEEQTFVLEFNAPATPQSVQAHVWCKPEDLGERVPVRRITGQPRADLLATLKLTAQAQAAPDRFHVLACSRRLTAGTELQLVIEPGVSTPSGLAFSKAQSRAYKVRAPFTASSSCERENAQAACMPIRPIQLSFSAPVTRAQAGAVRLRDTAAGGQSLVPQLEEEGGADDVVNSVRFQPPLPPRAQLQIELPAGFQDASGRPLANTANFPLAVPTADVPPLAKFAASPFGVVERYAEPDGPPLLPVTLRRVEAELAVKGVAQTAPAAGVVSTLRPGDDADIIRWSRQVGRYDTATPYDTVRRERLRADGVQAPPITGDNDRHWVATRQVSLLDRQRDARKLDLPRPLNQDPRPFEVVGIPLQPGFNVVEIASPLLGQSLLDAKYGAGRTMYVRTSALVTNLAVHFKLGRENALAWVTSLDKGRPVAGAAVRVSGCDGTEIATAVTGEDGIARFEGLSPQAPVCRADDDYRQAYFVSARAKDSHGGAEDDLAFTWSDWTRGIEPWRFNLPTDLSARPDTRLHTVLDRTLLRAGETVSMKHLLRTETRHGLVYGPMRLARAVATHVGSGDEFELDLNEASGTGATSEFAIPRDAKLGQYDITLTAAPDGDADSKDAVTQTTGSFRVEEFRLPVLQGRIAPASGEPLVATAQVPTRVQLDYVAGGPAGNLPVQVSALVRSKAIDFRDYDDFQFGPPRARGNDDRDEDAEGEDNPGPDDQRIVLDKAPLVLDRQGQGQLDVGPLPAADRPRELVLEATYADPNGEVQTLSSTQSLWPAAVVAGIRTEGWASVGKSVALQALALDLQGRAQAGVALSVRAAIHTTTTSRKRMVGGFYSYDHQRSTRDLGEVCSGKSDSRGRLVCTAKLDTAGEIELVATATDAQGRTVQAASSVWVTKQGELWFDAQDHDRIDLLPEQKSYQPGDTAVFQVRMPFRQATALITVEREGILETHVEQLAGNDPTVRLKVGADWGPNVYVSAFVLRGRLIDVPWYSFFTWGYKSPREWWRAFRYDSQDYVAPTALVDLSKPAYRLGVAEIRVGLAQRQLAVQVQADKPRYQVREPAQITITVKRADGQPAAHARVAVAAVDKALLELWPNRSWQLLDAMYQRRSWGVQTATAQMEIIGRRHYGRKAVPAGGDGGARGQTRELFDTLLLWQPDVQLDAQGQARLTVPLNDALTSFRIVAVADVPEAPDAPDSSGGSADPAGLFGTGWTDIQTGQDLQIISGLPPLVRDDDHYRAQLTLRNGSERAMKIEVTPRATLLTLAPQTVELAAGESREIGWDVQAPPALAQTRTQAILWEIEARDTAGSGARDALKVSQRVLPSVPVAVQQATLVQLDPAQPYALSVAPPPTALPGRGGVQIALQPTLAAGLTGVRDWFANYPYACLEQQASKAIGMQDTAAWQALMQTLPTYLDADGLASYFPPSAGDAHGGSDTLSAYLLAASDEAARLNPAFAMPAESRERLENALADFAEGRLQRRFWSPRADLDVRKLAAIEALSRHGKATPRQLESITINPGQWPTSAVIDWLAILHRLQTVPNRAQQLEGAQNVLRTRLSYQGTRLIFSTEASDAWWWLMAGGDVNTARLILAVLDDPAWRDDLGRLANGFIARQQGGAWHTTTANLWGSLALQAFSRRFESEPVAGTTRAQLGAAQASVDWRRVEPIPASEQPHAQAYYGAPAAPGMLRNNTMALPWPAAATAAAPAELRVTQDGSGRPWMTLQSVAAVPRTTPVSAGYTVKKTVTAVEQAQPALAAGTYRRGDVLRVRLEVNATADMSWVVINDPIPGGATILGSGLGRDSAIAVARGTPGADASSEADTSARYRWDQPWLAYQERAFDGLRAYYQFVPRGRFTLEYTVRLSNVGDFTLPPTRVEALYAPEMFGEWPNARIRVQGR